MANVDITDSRWWNNFRSQMPVARTWAYFDHAAVAPLCAPARDAMKDWSDDVAANGAVSWSKWRKTVERARDLAARCVRHRRRHLVAALAHQHVREREPRRRDVDDHLARSRLRILDLFDAELVRRFAEFVESPGTHGGAP